MTPRLRVKKSIDHRTAIYKLSQAYRHLLVPVSHQQAHSITHLHSTANISSSSTGTFYFQQCLHHRNHHHHPHNLSSSSKSSSFSSIIITIMTIIIDILSSPSCIALTTTYLPLPIKQLHLF